MKISGDIIVNVLETARKARKEVFQILLEKAFKIFRFKIIKLSMLYY